jgi:microcystin-dependent protein
MSEAYLSELRVFSFNFAPKGWALCNGQQLPINQNQALFSLLGTTYGGNGQTTFALPDLRGRVPLHVGNDNSFTQGAAMGEEAHTITISELPTHPHVMQATTTPASAPAPSGGMLATVDNSTFGSAYAGPSNLAPMAAGAISPTGGSQAHENRMPFLVLNICICLQGIFPSRN